MYGDLASVDKLVLRAQKNLEVGVRVRSGQSPVWNQKLAACADSAYANIEGIKSQFGVTAALTHDMQSYAEGELDRGTLIIAYSAMVKRVCRSTLATEAYAVSEGLEEAVWVRQVITECLMASTLSRTCCG